MLESLTVLNIASGSNYTKPTSAEVFVLPTCQRTLIVGFNQKPFDYALCPVNPKKQYYGQDAYQFLLEVICGLQSQVLGEYEIVGQFKKAYREYFEFSDKNSLLMNILEKLFKDAKDIRHKHLLKIGQLSYAGIARKVLMDQVGPGKDILIVGSGELAEDLIKILSKKWNICLMARNEARMTELAAKYGVSRAPLKDRNGYSTQYAYVINTVGCKSQTLFDEDFFTPWQNQFESRIFVDLGSPSVIKTTLTKDQGVLRLEDIFDYTKSYRAQTKRKVENAFSAIETIVADRKYSFGIHHPFGWEELQFA